MLVLIIIGVVAVTFLFITNVYLLHRRAIKGTHKLYDWPLLGNIIELIFFYKGFPPGLMRALIDGMPTGQLAYCRLIQPVTIPNDMKLWHALAEDPNLLQRGPSNSPNQGAVILGMTHNGLLMNMNIPRWQYLRKVFQKGLTANLINSAARDVVAEIGYLLSTKYRPDKDGIIRIDDIYRFMYFLISKVILKLGFGIIAEEGLQEKLAEAMQDFLKAFSYLMHTPMWLQKSIFRAQTQIHHQNSQKLYGYIDILVKEKMEKGLPEKPKNLLEGLLIAANQMDGKDQPPTVSEIRQCLIEMLLGGFDTTSNTGAFMFYAIAEKYAESDLNIQKELQKQVDKLMVAYPTEEWVGYTAQSQWPLIDAVVRETLRAHPVAEFTSRGVDKAFDIKIKDDKGVERNYHIPEGRIVFPLVTQWTEAFPHPERFDPVANFINNDKMARIYATPFGLGPRACVGRFLAEAELRTVLSTIIRKYELQIPSTSPWQSAYDVPRKFAFVTQVGAPMPLNLIPRIN